LQSGPASQSIALLAKKLFYHGSGMSLATAAYLINLLIFALDGGDWVVYTLIQLVVRVHGLYLMQNVSALMQSAIIPMQDVSARSGRRKSLSGSLFCR
jgi:hypothetical protein